MDTVSQILTMANIHSNINVLLLENTQSFLAGTILHRMAGNFGGRNVNEDSDLWFQSDAVQFHVFCLLGHGNVVQLYNGDFPIR